jgi:hypothetical protein
LQAGETVALMAAHNTYQMRFRIDDAKTGETSTHGGDGGGECIAIVMVVVPSQSPHSLKYDNTSFTSASSNVAI